MTGTHDIDDKWLKDVRAVNNMVKIIPRLLLEHWSGADFSELFTNQDTMYKFVEFVVSFLEDRKLDGIVLEIWAQFGGHHKAYVLLERIKGNY